MNKKPESLKKSKKLAEDIIGEFDDSGQERLNPVEQLARDLNRAVEEAIQGTDEPWRSSILNMGGGHDEPGLVKLVEYIRLVSFYHVQGGFMQGCPLQFPAEVCRAVIDSRGRVEPWGQCRTCKVLLPESHTIARNKMIKQRFFKNCPVCGSKL
ncbi:MAG: hypothetical protein JXM72_12765 [Deltaproteobacteria bacterium]|nr:hypothetical protein [Deltaproteobacteria bacterium]